MPSSCTARVCFAQPRINCWLNAGPSYGTLTSISKSFQFQANAAYVERSQAAMPMAMVATSSRQRVGRLRLFGASHACLQVDAMFADLEKPSTYLSVAHKAPDT